MSDPQSTVGESCYAHFCRADEALRAWLRRHSPLPAWLPPHGPKEAERDDPIVRRALALQERDGRRGIRGLFATYRQLAEAEWQSGELDVTSLTEAQLMRLVSRALREGKKQRALALIEDAPLTLEAA